MSASLLHQADGVVWDNGYSKKKKITPADQ